MQKYRDFSVCTRQALDYACLFYDMPLSDREKQDLMEAYQILPLFRDVREGLALAESAGFRLFAFSNGSATAVDSLLQNAGIRGYFADVVSVEETNTFKPSPVVYRHFMGRAAAVGGKTWLISSNNFDVIGALAAGMCAAWVQRSSDTPFDPWDIEPTITIHSLVELVERIAQEMARV